MNNEITWWECKRLDKLLALAIGVPTWAGKRLALSLATAHPVT